MLMLDEAVMTKGHGRITMQTMPYWNKNNIYNDLNIYYNTLIMNPIHFFDHIFTYKTNFSDNLSRGNLSQNCRPFSFNILLVNTVCTVETPTVSCP